MATKFLKWSALSSTAAIGFWSVMIMRRVRHVKSSSISSDGTSANLLLNSSTCCSVVNPRRHQALFDTRSIHIQLPPSKRGYSNEQILADFVKGFFGGWVFAPERALLSAFQYDLVGFSGIPKPPQENSTRPVAGVEGSNLPALHAILFGAFQIVGVSMEEVAATRPESVLHSSYIDIAFGSDMSSFAGVHRFVVDRHQPPNLANGEVVRITFASMACNPTRNRPIYPSILYTFHIFYAHLLFREGVAQLMEE